MNLIRVNAAERFLLKLAGVKEPERKRKIIGEEFIRVFEAESKKLGRMDYLVQGTIYPDVIESGMGDAAVIKSHHNVGGLPDDVDFQGIIEPLRDLFKDEVRAAGLELGIPANLVWRQPFPGPGLAIRIMGEITEEKLSILREADAIFREEIVAAGLEKQVNQYFAVLTNVRSVGVMGDARTYDYTVALRAVTTTDFMTAEWAQLPYELLARASSRITNEVPNVNRVVMISRRSRRRRWSGNEKALSGIKITRSARRRRVSSSWAGRRLCPSAMDIIFIYVAGNQFDCLPSIYFGFGCSLAEGCTGMTAPMFIIINQGSGSGSQRCSENA